MNKQRNSYRIAVLGMLIALQVVFTRVFAIQTDLLRISFDFLPATLIGALFDPFWSGTAQVIADLIGMLVLSNGQPYFWGFTFNALIVGIIYGFFYYQKQISLQRIIIATIVYTLLLSFILTPMWLKIMYHVPYWSLFWVRLGKSCILMPIQIITTYLMFKTLPIQKFNQ